MVAEHKAHPAFIGGGLAWAEAVSQAVAAYWRSCDGETLLILNNLSGSSQPVVVAMPDGYTGQPLDLLAGSYPAVVAMGQLRITLAPYQYIWYKL